MIWEPPGSRPTVSGREWPHSRASAPEPGPHVQDASVIVNLPRGCRGKRKADRL